MEEKKFDKNSLIGFLLLFVIIAWMMYNTQEKAQKEQLAKAKTEKATPKPAIETKVAQTTQTKTTDSVALKNLQTSLGSFGYSATLPSAKEDFTVLENNLLYIKIANKGGYIAEAKLKNFERFEKNSKQLVELVSKNNASLNVQLHTKDNRVINTQEMFFEPSLSKIGENQVLSMKFKANENEFLEYKYVLKPNDYMLDFDIHSQGLNKVVNTSKPANLEWNLKTYRNEKSISYENRYTEIRYEYDNGKDSYVNTGKEKIETPEALSFVAYKQHYFSSILLTKTPFKTSKLISNDLVDNEEKDTVFTKDFSTIVPLEFANGELDYKMNWYYGPTDYKILNSYDKNLDSIISLGWGLFGWINKFIFIPLFAFLSSFLNYGIAIIVFTIIIKIAMSPITFKSFLSQAKMKVLRPELQEINEKFKDPMKRQQETMSLYRKAGVNPMAGCIPALIQIPFMYASFMFFPTSVELRQKSFLWANDLSSFDQIATLPFKIPIYGGHVSLFPILAAIAIFFYMKMTSSDQAMAQPQQEGMPDMGKMMKIMIYISPIMMLIFFNNYGAGLSLYNLVSNVITIGIMLVIKNYIIDSNKIHAQIQENKTKPKTESKFQRKMREMMEQAEAQKQTQQKKK
jgi:YidC/Oxa1 family membrane protein insertase